MKRKICLFLALAVILSFTVCAGAIETPILPINPTVDATVKLVSDADSNVLAGTEVNFTTQISDVPKSSGIASAHFSYDYSDSLELDGGITLSGLPGWSVSDVTNTNGNLSFTISGPAVTSSFAVKFTFDVALNPTSRLSLTLDSVSLYDGNEKKVTANKTSSSCVFNVESVVPLFENIGASLRINNTPAIRFGMRVEKDTVYKKEFGSGNYSYSSSDNIKFGMLCIAKDTLSGELTVDTKGAHKELFKTPLIDNSGELVFVYEIDNLGSYLLEYVTRPYISFETESGDVVYFYGEAKTRNAEYVAKTELKSTTDTAKRELLNKFISE
ncbi:MAG: hypothetical protein IJ323_07065 [Clostridia bacterium]|nr:hypothetical protein [Clostridia bacterium]